MTSMSQAELEALIKQSAAGDRQAQENLVKAVQNRVYYHCRKMLKNQDDAMDATQDILLSMLNSLENLREPAAFWAWLNRMTSNVCCKRLSRTRREVPLWEEEPQSGPLEPEDLDDQVVPDKVLDNQENRRMVVELVESLPEAQRLSVLFYYYDEMSVKEIAEAMETSESTVKSRLHYARNAIRKGVEKYAAEGFKLYGVTPVPFLRYFLQKEAVDAAAAVAGKAALAAAAGGTAATAALSKALGGALARKGLMALAGLALTGAVTGGILLHRPSSPPEETPSVTLAETVSPAPQEFPALAAEPAAPIPAEQVPEIPEPRQSPPVWMGQVPAERPQAPEALGSTLEESELPTIFLAPENEEPDGAQPADSEPEDPKPETTPDDEPEKQADRVSDRDSVRNDDDSDDGNDDDDSDGGGSENDTPVPDPQPSPEEPLPDPPAVSVQYAPDPNFSGDYLGTTQDGVHEFLYTARLPDRDSQQFPLQRGNFFSKLEIANPMVVHSSGPYIYGVDAGETDVRYYVSEKEEGPYELKALVHVQVLRQPTEPGEGYELVGMPDPAENGALTLARKLCADGTDQPQPLVFKGCEMKLESSDPAVLGVRAETNRFYGVAPGTAEGRVYLRIGQRFPWDLAARVQFEVEPVPEGPELCKPREDFSPENGAEGAREAAYQGTNNHGLYDFTVTVKEDDVFRLQPLAEETGAVEWSITRAVISPENLLEHTFRAEETGTADITYQICPENGGTFSPCAVVHVQVIPQSPPYFPNPGFGVCLGRDEQDVWRFEAELPTDGPGLPSALAEGNYYLRTVSGDPAIAAVRDGRLYGVAPGSVEVRYYVSETEDAGYLLQAIASVTVKAPEPELPEDKPLIPPGAEVINLDAVFFGQNNGYGCTTSFINAWDFLSKDELPSEMEYRSSDPKVVFINEKGVFTTLSAGKAVLAAWDPADPSVCYTLTFQVEDHFDWRVYPEEPPSLSVGTQSYGSIGSYSMNYASKIVGVTWSSNDPEILAVSPLLKPTACLFTAKAPGTVTVTAAVRFSLVTAADQLVELTDTVSFQATVLPAS